MSHMAAACRLFVFMAYWGNSRRATYLYLNCVKSKHIDWNINISFITHIDFDHAWTEHYPVTLRNNIIERK